MIRGDAGHLYDEFCDMSVAAIGWRQIAKLTENVPLTLWTLDELARTLMANYRETDAVTKQLVPLRYFYLPA